MPKRNNVSFTRARADGFRCPENKSSDRLNFSNLQGLCLEVSKSGSKKWVFSKKIIGVKGPRALFTKTLGDYHALKLDEAITLATPFSQLCGQGIDPRIKAQETKLAEQKKIKINSVTFKDLHRAYVEYATPDWSEKTLADYMQTIASPTSRSPSGGPLYSILDEPLASINRDRIEAWVEHESKLNRKATTAKARRMLFACLVWRLEQDRYEDLIDRKILSSKSIKAKTTSNRTKADDMVDPENLGILLQALSSIDNHIIRTYLLTTLLLGCRREEIMALKWTYLDPNTKSTKINCKIKGRVEDGGGRAIPVGDWLWSQLQNLPRHGDYIFYSAQSKSGRLQNPDKAFRQARAQSNLTVTIHGLRRTYSAIADAVGVPNEIQHFLQGHAPQGVRERHYKKRGLIEVRQHQQKIESYILSKHLNLMENSLGL